MSVCEDISIADRFDSSLGAYRQITLNRPHKRNALRFEMITAMLEAISSAGERAIVVDAAPPVFCAGLDLKEILDRGSPAVQLGALFDLLVALARHQHPTVSYVGGPARAGGVALACCAGFVAADADATFQIPGDAGYLPMARTLSPILAASRRKTVDNMDELPGQMLDAESALSNGLIDLIIDRGESPLTNVLKAWQARRETPQNALVDPSILSSMFRETNRRIERACEQKAVAGLIRHLTDRYG